MELIQLVEPVNEPDASELIVHEITVQELFSYEFVSLESVF